MQSCIGPRGLVRFSPQGTVRPLPSSIPDPSSDPSDSFLDVLPAKPVHLGDEWSDDFKVKVTVSRNLTQKITLRRRYTLESVNGNVATIHQRIVEITPVQDRADPGSVGPAHPGRNDHFRPGTRRGDRA